MMSPEAQVRQGEPPKPHAGATRVADALNKAKPRERKPKPELQFDMRLTMSADEILQRKDFAQMTAAEVLRARELIAKLVMPLDLRKTRRYAPDASGERIDPRRSFRRSLRGGGAVDRLEFSRPH